jgi:AsmA-like C-terminal region
VLLAGLGAAGWAVARHFQPFVREQAIYYLENKFGTGVELASFHVSVTAGAPWKLQTAVLRVTGGGLVLPYPQGENLPPLIRVGKFRLETGLRELWNSPRRVREVRIEQVQINIPPREVRNAIAADQPPAPAPPPEPSTGNSAGAFSVDTIFATDLDLNIYPADPDKPPRLFALHRLQFHGAGSAKPMRFEAMLTNPTPPGEIQTSGEFGPWQKDDPGLTPISGAYTFRNADLGVFRKIAGTLSSTGKYTGTLRRIEVDGETRTPNFRMTGGNPVPLDTRFHSIVDGTSGDTLLQPVDAHLANSRLIARGSVIRPKGAKRRTVILDVVMNKGHIEDVLRLAVKGNQSLMNGELNLRTKLHILPLPGDFNERLLLDGEVDMERSHFTAASVQEKLDNLSRRAQGKPKAEEISDVLSSIRGDFDLRDGNLTFNRLTFQVPGAAVHLKGSYGLDSEQIDFHGVARLQAKVSQTQTGWKRLVLKPVDPFFSKAGAGTLLPIKITGSRDKPEFGLDRGNKSAPGPGDSFN